MFVKKALLLRGFGVYLDERVPVFVDVLDHFSIRSQWRNAVTLTFPLGHVIIQLLLTEPEMKMQNTKMNQIWKTSEPPV